jgi:hypothetical protein
MIERRVLERRLVSFVSRGDPAVSAALRPVSAALRPVSPATKPLSTPTKDDGS